MQTEFKKAKIAILIPLLFFLLFLVFFLLNLYALTIEYSILNLIIEIILGIFEMFLLYKILKFLFTPKILLKINDEEIIIYKFNKKIEIKYQEIFTIYNVPSSVLTTSIFIIYLKNGKKIKIKYLKDDKIASLMIFSKLDHNFFIDKENLFVKFFVRIFNFFESLFLHFIKYPLPKELKNIKDIALKFKEKGAKKVFVLKYNHLNLTFIDNIFKNSDLSYFVFNKSIPNPSEEIVLEAKNEYLKNNCDSILAIGGGSVIDLAKALGVSIKNNKKDLERYSGLFKVRHHLPPFIVIPSTPASGSEMSYASVITFKDKKSSIISTKIIPDYIFYSDELISLLPKETLINSIMDALTHALESYLNVYRYKKYDNYALSAIKLIYGNLTKAINENNLEAKRNLFKASSLAGIAFSIKGVGNVHALSHALSYKYNLSHAKTNAIILPLVIKTYLYNKKAYKKINYISKNILNNTNLITYLDNLSINYGYNVNIKYIRKEDISFLAKHAKKEAIPLYGTPLVYSKIMYSYMYLNLYSYYKKEKK